MFPPTKSKIRKGRVAHETKVFWIQRIVKSWDVMTFSMYSIIIKQAGTTLGGGSDQSPPDLRSRSIMTLCDDDAREEEKGYKTSIGMEKRGTVHRQKV
jgi:hypothetical protein